uniref:Putative metalloprotease n=1 Tax=Ixodes ricinus TaxID=34613 RepID=A0A0K8R566_IXORI
MNVLLILVLCTAEALPAPKFCLSPSVDPPKEQGPEANETDVGVYFIYDENFRVKSNDQGQPTVVEYFLTLLNAAQLRFLDVERIRIVLSLVGAQKIQLTKQSTDYVKTVGRGRVQLNARSILEYVKEHFVKYKSSYEEGDVVIFISGLMLYRVPNEPYMWTGGPTIGGACGDDRVGLIHDDGQSFKGVNDLAQNIAFLLGATRDTLWSASHSQARLGFLTSAIGGGPRYGFSPESKEALLQFYEQNKDTSCWKEPPANRLTQKNTELLLPVNIFQKYSLSYLHTCHIAYKMHPCTKQESKKTGTVPCYSFCCGQNAELHHRQPRTAEYDGTPCKTNGICVSGKCVMLPTNDMAAGQ